MFKDCELVGHEHRDAVHSLADPISASSGPRRLAGWGAQINGFTQTLWCSDTGFYKSPENPWIADSTLYKKQKGCPTAHPQASGYQRQRRAKEGQLCNPLANISSSRALSLNPSRELGASQARWLPPRPLRRARLRDTPGPPKGPDPGHCDTPCPRGTSHLSRRSTGCSELEGTHKDHRVHSCPAQDSPKNHTVCLKALS